MSRLWDTPSFWVRSEADEMVRDYPSTDVRTLAASCERTSSNYDGEPKFARDVAAELHKRADAGIRFWPEPVTRVSGLAETGGLHEGEVRDVMVALGAGIEDEHDAYWWQRM